MRLLPIVLLAACALTSERENNKGSSQTDPPNPTVGPTTQTLPDTTPETTETGTLQTSETGSTTPPTDTGTTDTSPRTTVIRPDTGVETTGTTGGTGDTSIATTIPVETGTPWTPVDTGETGDPTTPGDQDQDGYPSSEDCDDTNPAIHPNAVEECNGVDDNCDGSTDEGLLQTYYADNDGDGFGASAATMQLCEPNDAFVDNSDDCDDSTAWRSPGLDEACSDGLDNDCDLTVDEPIFVVAGETHDMVWLDAELSVAPDGSTFELCGDHTGGATIQSGVTLKVHPEYFANNYAIPELRGDSLGTPAITVDAPGKEVTLEYLHLLDVSGGPNLLLEHAHVVTVLDSLISNGSGSIKGGGIYAKTDLLLERTDVFNNTADDGGGIYLTDAHTLTLGDGTTIGPNNASDSGGGLYLGASATVIFAGDAWVQANTANKGGGAHADDDVLIDHTSLTAPGPTFQGNFAEVGGAIWAQGAITLQTQWLASNNADSGGGLHAGGNGLKTITNSFFEGNVAQLSGGGAWMSNDSFLISDSEFTNGLAYGSASGGGAGLYLDNIDGDLTENLFVGNTASHRGGGVHIANNATVVIDGGELSDNSADHQGGAIFGATSSVVLTVKNGEIADNSSPLGAGIAMEQGHLSVDNMTITNNQATTSPGHGAGIWLKDMSSAELFHTLFSSNDAVGFGGGLYVESGSPVNVVNTSWFFNTATSGAGLYTKNNDLSGSATFGSNAAAIDGGAMFIDNATVFLDDGISFDVEFSQNSAGGEGGCAWLKSGGVLEVAASTLALGAGQEVAAPLRTYDGAFPGTCFLTQVPQLCD